MEIAINFWAVLISMVLSVLIGFVWYGPLFGKQWMKLSGISMPAQKPGFAMMLKPMIISMIGALLASITLSYSIYFMGGSGVMVGLEAAFWNWLGFMVPVLLNFVAWEGKSWKLFAINSGYWLVFLCAMGVLLTF